MILREYISSICINGPVVEYACADIAGEVFENLKSVSFVKRHMSIEGFYRLSMVRSDGKRTLMAEYNEGKSWYVIGFFDKDVPELPEWKSK